jgi:hypothetical protein
MTLTSPIGLMVIKLQASGVLREDRPLEALNLPVAEHVLSGHQQQILPVYRQAGTYSSRSELQGGRDLQR